MSSTNRSDARDAHISDYYVTPLHTIREFTDAFTQDCAKLLSGIELNSSPLNILDPCSGGDASHPMAYPNALQNYSGWNVGKINTVDIRADSLSEIKADYLNLQVTDAPDIAITNPPFNIAMSVIQKALTDVRPRGLVIMLLRLNFFGSRERQSFWQANMPVLTYVHTRRPKFLNTGGTDSIEYMHAVWQRGETPKFTSLRIV